MSDYQSSLPVRTQNAGDIVAKIVDGTITSQALAIDATGRIIVKLDDAAGNGITSQVNGAQRALDVGIDVAGVQIDPRQIRALTSADVVSAVQSTAAATHASPWWVRLTDGTNDSSLLATGELKVSVTQLLTENHAYGTVGASTLRTAAQLGNATGAADFNYGTVGVQSLRVASQIGNATGGADFNYGAISAQSIRTAAQIGNSGGAADFANGATSAQTLRVAANLAVGGANVSAVNPVPVTISSSSPGTAIQSAQTSSALAVAGSVSLTYTVTAAKTLSLSAIYASASSRMKIVTAIETGVATGVFTTKFVSFNSSAEPNVYIPFVSEPSVAAGVRVQATFTNLDVSADDVYCTFEGTEN